MNTIDEISHYCNQLLDIKNFKDYCPNGLQVEGKKRVQNVIGGVTACQALLDEAVRQQADAIIVHHGYFWKGESPVICGMKYRRIKTLMDHDINLLAYHLPLDAHPRLGNNAQLASALGMQEIIFSGEQQLIASGRVTRQTQSQFQRCLEGIVQRRIVAISGGDFAIQKIALCSGAAQQYIEQAAQLGVDAFISGEISEHTVHFARENQIHYFAAGHHATERFGIKALCAHLQQHFMIDCKFVDIDNPV